MRLHIRIKNEDYYDIGLRGEYGKPSYSRRFGELQPKHLEDFIEKYGKKSILILSYGSLWERKQEIDNMLV